METSAGDEGEDELEEEVVHRCGTGKREVVMVENLCGVCAPLSC